MDKVKRPDAYWRDYLSPEAFRVTRQKRKERPFTGRYHDTKEDGVYTCICCDLPLFDSQHKYETNTGWPSFYQPISAELIELQEDRRMLFRRTAVSCARCDAHLGHVFADHSVPSRQRYRINSAALRFAPRPSRLIPPEEEP